MPAVLPPRTAPALGALVLMSLAAPAFANPIPTYVTPSGMASSDAEVAALGAAAALLEWIVLRDGLRGRVRSDAILAGVICAAHLVSYPATVKVAERMLLRTMFSTPYDATWWIWVQSAELVAVGLEFGIYVAAFRFWRRSPVAPPPSIARLLVLVITANALTWSLGLIWSAWRGWF